MSRKYTAQEMREMASVVLNDVKGNYYYGATYEFTSKFDENIIEDMLRQAADDLDRKKEYEYAVEYCEFPGKWEVYKDGLTLVEAQKLSSESWSNPHRIVRREVGEWEQVVLDEEC